MLTIYFQGWDSWWLCGEWQHVLSGTEQILASSHGPGWTEVCNSSRSELDEINPKVQLAPSSKPLQVHWTRLELSGPSFADGNPQRGMSPCKVGDQDVYVFKCLSFKHLIHLFRNSATSLVGRHRSCGNLTILSSAAFYPFKVGQLVFKVGQFVQNLTKYNLPISFLKLLFAMDKPIACCLISENVK